MEESVDSPEITLKQICCTCLTRDRRLYQLCRLNDGINNLYSLLSYDSEAYREGFYKDTGNLFICWECKAIMRRITEFRTQACVAQKHLSAIVDGRNDMKTMKSCLSRLTVHHDKVLCATVFTCDTGQNSIGDNFVDCGLNIKSESDLDDVPLSELHNNSLSDNDETKRLDEWKKVVPRKQENKSKKNNSETIDSNKDHNNEYETSAFKCVKCLLGFKSLKSLKKHNIVFHMEGKSKRKQSLNSGSRPRRNQSMMDKKTNDGFPCTECNKYFDNKSQRWKHIQRHHREGFKCETCGKRFAFKNNRNRHQQLHQAPLPREECQVCHKMIRVDLVRIHARIHSQREKFSCVECDKTFVSRASYEHHLKYTQAHAAVDILKYKCSKCDKGYRSKGELRDHMDYQHMGKTRHKCPICGKALATRRCITRHVRRAHHGLKESARDKICQQCGKAFRDKKGLREHEFIHTGERPLSCEICGCTFRQSASLYTHRKRVHKIYPEKKNVELLES